MKKVVSLSVVALLLSVVLAVGAAPTVSADPVQRVFVEFKPGTGAAVRGQVLAAGGKVHFSFDRIDTLAVSVSERAMARLARNPNVVQIEPDPVRYPAAEAGSEQVVPYGIDMVQAPQVQQAGVIGEGVTVCIIDTGFGVDHQDLQGIPVDGYSQVDDAWDHDGYGHGTHVAGTIAGQDNDIGVVGVSPGVELYIVKIFDDAGEWVPQARASNLMAAAEMCADNGAQIISMSLGGSQKTTPEQRTFDALYAEGILSIAAAGNDGTADEHYPSCYDSVISVAAIDADQDVADFSQFNDQAELAAPGVSVLSTLPYVNNTFVFAGDETYEAATMEYTPFGTVTGQLADGGLCTEPGEWDDMVVLCQRGEISFRDKVVNVKKGGGSAAVVYNNEPGILNGTMGQKGNYIPAVGISLEDGVAATAFSGEVTVQSEPPTEGSSYEAWDGTSMATPHVSGVAALLWSACPECTNDQIREAMAATALNLGDDDGWDVHYGYGLVQAYDAWLYLMDAE